MFAKKIWNLLLLTAALAICGCSEERESAAPAPAFELTAEISADRPLFVVPGKDLELTYTAENVSSVVAEGLPEGWSVRVDETARRIGISATPDAATKAAVTITAAGAGAEKIVRTVELCCLNAFDDPNGTFVLNEGNMTTENGSLIWISPEGYLLDDAYKTVNGSELGNVAQDMAFCGDRIYVISQNGDKNPNGTLFENDGMLVVMDARTLKKTDAFTREELAGLDWPTHIAVLDEQHIYIRDNKGIHRLDATTRKLTFIEGSDGAPKSRFMTMNGKVYTYKSGYISKLLEIAPGSDAVTSLSMPYRVDYDINEVLGIQKADDGKIWILSFGFGTTAIGKFDPAAKTIVQRKISFKPEIGSSGVTFVARGNDLYYADGTTIYHMPFNETEEVADAEVWMVDVSALDKHAGLSYNGLGVHPVTGRVYINTIKSYAQFTQNQIWGFDFAASAEAPAVKYENCTHFPAGFFFAGNN